MGRAWRGDVEMGDGGFGEGNADYRSFLGLLYMCVWVRGWCVVLEQCGFLCVYPAHFIHTTMT